jgi:transcriptional regulator with XRE-family HTH domain
MLDVVVYYGRRFDRKDGHMISGSLAERLRVLRAQRGMTLVEAAEQAGVGRDTLSDLERGRRHPVMPTLAKIAKGYGVSVEDLLAVNLEWASTPDLDTFNRKASEASSEELRDLIIRLTAGLPSAATLEDLRERPSDPTRVTRALDIARIHLIGDVLRARGEEPPERIAVAIRQWQKAMTPPPDEESRRDEGHGAA